MPLKSYEDLVVWQRSLSLAEELYRLTTQLPADERFGIVAQLRRAVVSVCANIAEGYGRRTRGEYVNQLSVASGSVTEISALLRVSERLHFLARADIEPADHLTREIRAMLWRMIERLEPNRQHP
jgi:four helix bundle protein